MPLPFSIPMPKLPFGELVRNYRQMRGMTVEELAEAIHLAPSAVRTIEEGAGMAPPSATVKALADVFQLEGEDRELFMAAAALNSPFLRALTNQKDTQQQKLPTFTASILVFMIADVRGYTHFTQTYGDHAAAQLTTKVAEISRSMIERWDGRVVELRGDEVMAVFGSVRQALQAALAMQAEFAAATQAQPNLPLDVGIGLDVGEVAVLDDGYRGAALNRAARLCGVADGGDILITNGLKYIASLVEGVSFVERGRMQLKGFEDPVDILGVVQATLEAGKHEQKLLGDGNG
jgi:class 3 adenylate cyclase